MKIVVIRGTGLISTWVGTQAARAYGFEHVLTAEVAVPRGEGS